jgi:uncharacterized FlaG/YvyC family protein
VNISSISSEVGIAAQSGSVAKLGDSKGNEPGKTKANTTNSATVSSSSSGDAETGAVVQSVNGDSGEPPVPLVINSLGIGLKFLVDKTTNTPIIEVIDLKSGEVVRQIPPKEMMNFLREVRVCKGLFLPRRL